MQYIKIKDMKIPVQIKSYKNAKSIKIYFKGNALQITKPTRISIEEVLKLIKKDENKIYDKYKELLSSEINTTKQWENGEKTYYKGEEFTIVRKSEITNIVSIKLEREQKKILITLPEGISQENAKINVDKLIKKLLKNNTEVVLAERLPYWSKITQIGYNEVKVRDAITKYGSCVPSKKLLHFSSRLVMLPEDKIDAIIVHELCHMIHTNHSKEFYKLVEKFIPNYIEIDEWLKINSKTIMF